MSTKAKKLLSIKTVAELYDVKPQTIYYWLRYKKFDYVRIGRRVLVAPEVLEKFFLENTVNGG
jgi:excisionase family DNA binding protein